MALTQEGYRHRLIEGRLETCLRSFGGVSIEGPKWCGKTWVGLNASESAYMIGGSDEFGQSNKELALMNLNNALDGDPPHLIDEWQEIPVIWDAVRSRLDQAHSKGLYVLTGSSTPKKNKPVHSGAGRIKHLRMRPMSLFESGESSGEVSLKNILEGEDIGIHRAGITLERLTELAVVGGWPGNMGLPYEERVESVRGYLESTIRSAAEMDGIRRDEAKLWLVMRSLARNEGTLASAAKIRGDTGIPLNAKDILAPPVSDEGGAGSVSYNTVGDYLDVFDRLYLLDDQPAFDPCLKSSVRVGKTAKRHLADPSLAIAALNVGKERLMKDLKTFGCFFESLCERDLRIYAESLGGQLSHYRDDSGREIDAVIEMPDGNWSAFEIKLGAHKINDAADSLKKISSMMEKHGGNAPKTLCVICGLTEHAYRRDDGVYVVPITMLGP